MAQFEALDRVPNEWRELILLDAAVRVGLIDGLDARGPVKAGDLADASELDRRAVTTVLDALVDLGYAVCDGDGYRLSVDARGFLVDTDDPRYRRNALAHSAHQLRRWTALADVIRDGGPAPAVEERDTACFIDAMDDASRADAPAVVRALLAAVPGARRVLDVGGGPGTYATVFAAQGVATLVLDVPEVVDLVTPRFEGEPLVRYVAGDMHRALPPGPFDIVLAANVLHTAGPERNRALVARAAGVLAPTGAFAAFEFLLGVSPRAPMFAVNMLTSTPEGRCYREDEIASWCREAGLAPESAVDFPGRDEQLVIARQAA